MALAQDANAPEQCERDGSYEGFLADFIERVNAAFSDMEATASALSALRGHIEARRHLQSRFFHKANLVIDSIDQATATYTSLADQIASDTRAAGGRVSRSGGGTSEAGFTVPPLVRVTGAGSGATNTRLEGMRGVIDTLHAEVLELEALLESSATDLEEMELTEQRLEAELARNREALKSARRSLDFAARICGDQHEREIEDALTELEPDSSAPDADLSDPTDQPNPLDEDEYWQRLLSEEGDYEFLDYGGNDDPISVMGEITVPYPDDGWQEAQDDAGFEGLGVRADPAMIKELRDAFDQTTSDRGYAGNPVPGEGGGQSRWTPIAPDDGVGLPGDAVPVLPGDAPQDTESAEEDAGLPGTSDPVLPSQDSDDTEVAEDDGEAGLPGAPGPSRQTLVPALPEINLPTTAAGQIGDLAALQERITALGITPGSIGMSAEACGWDAELICGRLRGPSAYDEAACMSLVSNAVAECQAYQARSGPHTLQSCLRACDLFAGEASTGLNLHGLAIAKVRGLSSRSELRLTRLKADQLRIRVLEEELRSAVESHIVHVYMHADTGEMTLHDGDYFAPTPPIIYAGATRGPATPRQVATMAGLHQREAEIAAEIARLKAQIAASGDRDWRAAALDHWNRIAGFGSLDACETPAAISQRQLECRAFCQAQDVPGASPPEPLDMCRTVRGPLQGLMSVGAPGWLVAPSDRRAP